MIDFHSCQIISHVIFFPSEMSKYFALVKWKILSFVLWWDCPEGFFFIFSNPSSLLSTVAYIAACCRVCLNLGGNNDSNPT